MFKTLVDASEHLFLVRQPLAHGSEKVGQLCARRGRGFDHLSEESARVVWCSDRQLLLEAPKCADLVHKGKVATKVTYIEALQPGTVFELQYVLAGGM